MLRRPLALLALVFLAACPSGKETSKLEPIRPKVRTAAYLVAQSAVDGALPSGVDAYEAWDVTWQGMQPTRVLLERFVRGKCFARGRYELADRGRLSLESEEVRAESGGGPVAKGKVLLADAIESVAGPKVQGRYFERDPVGHLAWIYESRPADRGPPVETVEQFDYANEGCILPALLDRAQVPARKRPAGSPDSMGVQPASAKGE